jgi:hypothetical protein
MLSFFDQTNSIILLGAAAVVLIVWLSWQEVRLNRLLRGKEGSSLEETISALIKEVDELREFEEDMMKYCALVETRLRSSTRGIGVVRFDAFSGNGDGGRQSFAVAMIDERGDGVIISSILARERARVFAKPIERYESDYELTEEETVALTKAKDSCKVDA